MKISQSAHFDSPFPIVAVDKEHSMVTLDLPNSANFYPVFHTSDILPFTENDNDLYPACTLHKPDPVLVDGEEQHIVDHIVAARCRGEGPEGDVWLQGMNLKIVKPLILGWQTT